MRELLRRFSMVCARKYANDGLPVTSVYEDITYQ